MEKLLVYEVNGFALESHKDKIVKLLEEWLNVKNKLDVVVTTFAFEEMGTINIDCYRMNKTDSAKMLTEQLLNELNIEYTLATPLN